MKMKASLSIVTDIGDCAKLLKGNSDVISDIHSVRFYYPNSYGYLNDNKFSDY